MADGFGRDEVRDDMKQSNTSEGGVQLGGGAGGSDVGAGGGSSGGGGYGNDQNSQNHRDQSQGESTSADARQSRGERFDELSGGGRGPESVSYDKVRDGTPGDEYEEERRTDAERGGSEAESEG
jgi:hypothetical protein